MNPPALATQSPNLFSNNSSIRDSNDNGNDGNN